MKIDEEGKRRYINNWFIALESLTILLNIIKATFDKAICLGNLKSEI